MDSYKNPGVAAVLSFIFTGLGQTYNGQIGKGLLLMLISAVSVTSLIIGAVITRYWFVDVGKYEFSTLWMGISLIVISILVIAITGIYNIYDAYNVAKSSKE